ncbi:MAG: hypothetical protein IV100_30550 [Myxococcales bacterium]|nr:hypothetical protein [Myxococcales bacterium]
MSAEQNNKVNKISRGEIEVLCILCAIGRLGVTVTELTERLGISATLTPFVMKCVSALPGDEGWIATDGDRLTLTIDGSRHLTTRLKELGTRAPRW